MIFTKGTNGAKGMLVSYAVMGTITFFMFPPVEVLKGLELLDECVSYLGECFSETSFLLLSLSSISAFAGLLVYSKKSLLIGVFLNYGLLVLAWGGYASYFYLSIPKGLGLGGLYIVALLFALIVISVINLILLPVWIKNVKRLNNERERNVLLSSRS